MGMLELSLRFGQSLPFRRLEHKLLLLWLLPLLVAALAWLGQTAGWWAGDDRRLLPGILLAGWLAVVPLMWLLLYPWRALSRALQRWYLHDEDPKLPAMFGEDAGRTLGSVQLLVERLHQREKLLASRDLDEYLETLIRDDLVLRRIEESWRRVRDAGSEASLVHVRMDNRTFVLEHFGPAVLEHACQQLRRMIHGAVTVPHWLARRGEDGWLLFLEAGPEEGQIITNRIRSAVRSTAFRAPSGQSLNLSINLRFMPLEDKPDTDLPALLGELGQAGTASEDSRARTQG